MRVLKYLPRQLFGFAVDEEGNQVFFHVNSFSWGEFRINTPPIIGEEVMVEYASANGVSGKAPRARSVERVSEPTPNFGVVENFDEARGYGSIKTSDGRLHYLHRSEMTDGRLPMPGMSVRFFEGFRKGRTRACYVALTGEDDK